MASWNVTNLSEIEFNRIEAEFYQNKFIQAKKIGGNKSLKKYQVNVIHPAEVKRVYTENGSLQIVLAQNVRDNVMDWSTKRLMSQSLFSFIGRNKLYEGDVLVTRSGANYGQTSVIAMEPKLSNLFACADVLVLKPGEIGGPLLSTFLNTKTGKSLMVRGVYGAGQPHVAPSYISNIPFPEYLLQYRSEIEELINRSRTLQYRAQTLYKEATDLLEQELGLDEISFEKPKSYKANFSEIINNYRNDADFYQMKYRQLDTHLKTKSTVSLASICRFLKGYEVGTSAYTQHGLVFIRVSNLTKDGFKFGDSDKYISETTYSKLKIYNPKIGDILLTKDGTIGICYVVDENISGITSSGIMNLELTDKKIPKEYLALVINSKICQMQAERECSGALITHWKPEQIRKLRIPILKQDVMQSISDLVILAKNSRKQANQLLVDAKARVEQLIKVAAIK